MRLHSLRLTNFRQHADSEIHFATGLTGIVGTNGAGKSTVLEALTFALFGADAVRGTKGSIRWNRAPARKQAEVVLRFEVNGVQYLLERAESGASLETESVEIASGTSAVNAAAVQLLGMTLREFLATFFVAQKDLARLASMGGTERQTFFRNIMGVGRVDDALKLARQSKNALAIELAGVTAGMGDRAPRLAEATEAEAAVRDARADEVYDATQVTATGERRERAMGFLADWTKRRDEYSRLTHDIVQAEREVEQASAQVDRLAGEIEEAEKAAITAERLAPQVEEIPALRERRDALVEARSRVDQVRTLAAVVWGREQELVDALEWKADGEREAALYDAAAHERARDEWTEATAQLTALRDRRRAQSVVAKAEGEQASLDIARLRKRLAVHQEAGADGECPTCSRTLGEQYEAVLTGVRNDLQDAEARLRSARERCDIYFAPSAEEDALESHVEKLSAALKRMNQQASDSAQGARSATAAQRVAEQKQRELDEARAQLAALPATVFDPAELAAVEDRIGTLEDLSRVLATTRAMAERKPALRLERGVWLTKSEEAVQRSGEAMIARQALGFDVAQYAEVQAEADRAQQEHDAAKLQHARVQVALREAEARHRRAVALLEEYDGRARQMEDLAERVRIAEVAASRMADFRVSVASGIRPEMEELVSGFVSILTDGRFEAVTLNEDFECQMHRGGIGMEVVSGGEEDVAALAMRLATSQMIAERAGHPLSLLILDEPFASLDEVRRGNLLALFERLNAVFPQVVVITHVPEIAHSVDHLLRVDFDEARGCSVVTQDAMVPA